LVAAVAAVAAIAATPLSAAGEVSREYQVKAAFLYNFVQFVDWPARAFASEQEPITIGIVGHDPFQGVLDQIVADKRVNGRELVVRRFQGAGDLGRCHLLFVGGAEAERAAAVIAKGRAMGALTVGEPEQFTRAGGVIRLFTEDNRVRFEVNLDAAEQAQLKISSKLLKLARIFKR